MIFKIQKDYSPKNIHSSIEYHEDKVLEGIATKDFEMATIAMRNTSQICEELTEHISTNTRIRKSHFHQISANFDTENTLPDTDKKAIISTYLEAMGYSNTLHVVYRHHDKNHDHWHIFATSTDSDNKIVNTRNDFHRSAKITRELEKTFGIRQLSEEGFSVSDKLINSEKYRYSRGIIKYLAMNPDVIEPSFQLALDNDVKNMSNAQMKRLYSESGQEKNFNLAIKLLSEEKLIEPTIRQRIHDQARIIRDSSSSTKEFIEKMNSKPFYARYVATENEITYGYESTYFKGAKLQESFSHKKLAEYFKEKKLGIPSIEPNAPNQGFDEVKKFVKGRIKSALFSSNTFQEFTDKLSKHEIITDLTRNSKNASLTFSHNGFKIKSSAIGYQYNIIEETLAENLKKSTEFKKKVEALNRKLKQGRGQFKKQGAIEKTVNSLTKTLKNDARSAEQEIDNKYNNLSQ